jgi:hypothetical protein
VPSGFLSQQLNARCKSPESQPGAFHIGGVCSHVGTRGFLGPKARDGILEVLQSTMFGLTDIVTLPGAVREPVSRCRITIYISSWTRRLATTSMPRFILPASTIPKTTVHEMAKTARAARHGSLGPLEAMGMPPDCPHKAG